MTLFGTFIVTSNKIVQFLAQCVHVYVAYKDTFVNEQKTAFVTQTPSTTKQST